MPGHYSDVGSFQIDQRYEKKENQSLQFMNEPAKNNMLEVMSQGPNTSMRSSPIAKQMITRK